MVLSEGQRLQHQLHTFVAGLEPRRLVKAPRVGPRLVGGKLHQTAVAPAAFLNRPLEDSPAETAAAPCSGHAHALDLPAPQSSEERRGGKECVSTCSSRWSTAH